MPKASKIFIEVLEEVSALAGQSIPGEEIFSQVADVLVKAFNRSMKVSARIGWDNRFYENRQR